MTKPPKMMMMMVRCRNQVLFSSLVLSRFHRLPCKRMEYLSCRSLSRGSSRSTSKSRRRAWWRSGITCSYLLAREEKRREAVEVAEAAAAGEEKKLASSSAGEEKKLASSCFHLIAAVPILAYSLWPYLIWRWQVGDYEVKSVKRLSILAGSTMPVGSHSIE